MKNIRLFISLFIALLVLSVQGVWAQDCFGVQIKDGSGFEMTTLNAKGKPEGVVKYRFAKVRQEGAYTVVDVQVEGISSKGKQEYATTYSMKCNGEEVIIDAGSLMMADQTKSLEGYNMKFTSEDVVVPHQLKVGQELKNASLHGEGNMSGLPVTFDMEITGRRVEGKEKITVGAGEFEAFKIPSTITMKTKTVVGVTFEVQSVSYRAPGVLWDIKTETYRKGKLVGSTELTKIL